MNNLFLGSGLSGIRDYLWQENFLLTNKLFVSSLYPHYLYPHIVQLDLEAVSLSIVLQIDPFRAYCDHAFGQNILVTLRGAFSWLIGLSGHLQQPYQ